MIRRELVDILHKNLGLNISSIGVRTLARSINRRIKELSLADQAEYVRFVLRNQSEIKQLIDEVVIPETWFFRDSDPFVALRDIAGKWNLEHPNGQLRVLSIPCASGEEPYSIAMTLLEAGWARTSFRLDAVDISAKIIERARRAVYTKNSFRNKDVSFRDKYFIKSGNSYALKREISSTVNFHCGNILDLEFMAGLGFFDIIFCRNILFYLDLDSQQRIVRKLAQLLQPQGCLFVGTAEAIRYLAEGFAPYPHGYPFATILQLKKTKRAEGKDPISVKAAIPDKNRSAHPLSGTRSSFPETFSAENIDTGAAAKMETARRLADAGKLKEAEIICEDILSLHGPAAEVYYLLGILRDFSGQPAESVKFLKKALYLLPDHTESLMLLTYLCDRLGDQKAVNNYKRRLHRLEKKKLDHSPYQCASGE